MMDFGINKLYYIGIAIQVIALLHCIRKGNQQKWMYIILFLPVVGGIVYMVMEMFSRRDIQQVQTGLGNIINPSGSIRKLEENLRFSDTFNNRIALADAYLAGGQTDKALSLYEGSYNGAFTENEYLLKQLITAYYLKQRYQDILPLAKKLYPTPQFLRSNTHLLYAMALEHTDHIDEAEKEFKLMNVRYSHFNARYEYALFLYRGHKQEEARALLQALIEENSHLSSRERGASGPWIARAKDTLREWKQ